MILPKRLGESPPENVMKCVRCGRYFNYSEMTEEQYEKRLCWNCMDKEADYSESFGIDEED